jgi:hypothetical protein
VTEVLVKGSYRLAGLAPLRPRVAGESSGEGEREGEGEGERKRERERDGASSVTGQPATHDCSPKSTNPKAQSLKLHPFVPSGLNPHSLQPAVGLNPPPLHHAPSFPSCMCNLREVNHHRRPARPRILPCMHAYNTHAHQHTRHARRSTCSDSWSLIEWVGLSRIMILASANKLLQECQTFAGGPRQFCIPLSTLIPHTITTEESDVNTLAQTLSRAFHCSTVSIFVTPPEVLRRRRSEPSLPSTILLVALSRSSSDPSSFLGSTGKGQPIML